jgi:hypothetical protein
MPIVHPPAPSRELLFRRSATHRGNGTPEPAAAGRQA